MIQQTAHKQRIQWIDAMRGVTMVLVVFSHIQVVSLGMTHSIVNNFFSMFRMPLFFFVSGFIAYQASIHWTTKEYAHRLGHKAQVQIIPMLIFGLLYSAVIFTHKYHCSIPVAFKCFFLDRTHLGYWFTEVLLLMFIIYYTLSLLLRNKPKVLEYTMAGIAVVFFLLSLRGVEFYSRFAPARVLCLHQIFLYFQFFTLGNLVARHPRKTLHKFGSNKVSAGIILSFITFFALYRLLALYPMQSAIYKIANKGLLEIVRISGMFAMVALFYRHKDSISKGGSLSRCFQFVGQRTLDVYLMHFFLLPVVALIGKVYPWGNNVVILTLFCLVAAMALTALCLLISKIVRISPFLAHYLYGVKRAPKA